MRRTLLTLFAALSAAASPVLAESHREASPTLEIPFERYSLDNGLEVILHVDRRVPLVATSVWYHVGGFHEPAKRSGFAHLFEHMMFQGSAHVGDDRHISMLQELGGTGVNGTTNFDRTNYIETVPSNHLETVLWLEADRMGLLLPALTIEKLDTQREVVKNERRQSVETAPYGLAEEKAWQALFPLPHPYNGQVIGSMADLDAASLDDVRDFFERYYTPANATLCLAGDFDPAVAKALIHKYFGTLPSRPRPEEPQVDPAALTAPVVLRHEETVGTLPKLFIYWHSPKFFAKGDADLDILSSVLSGDRAARLDRKLVHDLELAQSVAVYQYSLGAQSAYAVEVLGRPGADLERIWKEVDAVLAEVREGGITEAELRRAKDGYLTQFVSSLQQLGGMGGRAEVLQRYNHFLGDPGMIGADYQRLQAVSTQSVQAAVREHLSVDKRVVLLAVPQAASGQGPEGTLQQQSASGGQR
jgi:predicted Zn-dependent peptidase